MSPVLIRNTRSFVIASALFAVVALSAAYGAPPRDARGRTLVIVTLNLPQSASSAAATTTGRQVRMEAIATAQDRILGRLTGDDFSLQSRWSMVPGLAVWASQGVIERLRHDPDVAAVDTSDSGGHANLTESLPLIRADLAHAAGHTGGGVRVAILDTGIDRNHPDFQGAIADEACFCVNADGTGCCPNHLTSQFGSGAAQDDNGHGTNVAGILASRGNYYPPAGVAPGASIVAVKVIDADNSFSSITQVIDALNWLLQHHPEVRVVNMSLGTNDRSSTYCDSAPAYNTPLSSAISSLRGQGALTFASSGNDGSGTTMESPACIANTVAVGSVYDSSFGSFTFRHNDGTVVCTDATTKADQISCFSNAGSMLDLLAPGASIRAAGLNGGYSSYAGTSQASPHAAGTAALLFSSNPSLTPAAVEQTLKATGTQIRDPRNGLKFPRVDALAATEMSSFCAGSAICGSLYRVADDGTGGPAPDGWTVSVTGGFAGATLTDSRGFFKFGVAGGCASPQVPFTLFAASPAPAPEYWGVSSVGIYSFNAQTDCTTPLGMINVPPVPHPPTFKSPSSGQLVTTTSITPCWQFNDTRTSPSWPTTYSLYKKYWESGTTEPSWGSPIWTGTCVPSSNCSACSGPTINTSVVGQYKLKVDITMDVTRALTGNQPSAFFGNTAAVSFSVPGGRCLGCRFP